MFSNEITFDMKTLQIFLLFVLWFAVDSYPQDVISSSVDITTTGLLTNVLKSEGLSATLAPSEGINDGENKPTTINEEPQDADSTPQAKEPENTGLLSSRLTPLWEVISERTSDATNIVIESLSTLSSSSAVSSVPSWEATSEKTLEIANIDTESQGATSIGENASDDSKNSTTTSVPSSVQSWKSTSEETVGTIDADTASQGIVLRSLIPSDDSISTLATSSSSSSPISLEATSEGDPEIISVDNESQGTILRSLIPSDESLSISASSSSPISESSSQGTLNTTLSPAKSSEDEKSSTISTPGSTLSLESTSEGVPVINVADNESQGIKLRSSIPSDDSVSPSASSSSSNSSASSEFTSDGPLEVTNVDNEYQGLRTLIPFDDLIGTLETSSSSSSSSSWESTSEGAPVITNIDSESQSTLGSSIPSDDSTSFLLSSSSALQSTLAGDIEATNIGTKSTKSTSFKFEQSSTASSISLDGSISQTENPAKPVNGLTDSIAKENEILVTESSAQTDEIIGIKVDSTTEGAETKSIPGFGAEVIPDATNVLLQGRESEMAGVTKPPKLENQPFADTEAVQNEASSSQIAEATEVASTSAATQIVQDAVSSSQTIEATNLVSTSQNAVEDQPPAAFPSQISKPTDASQVRTESVATSSPLEVHSTFPNPCNDSGNFSNPTNCQTYITCSGNSTELLLQENECPERSVFSPALRRCTRDISPCGETEPICLKAGSIPRLNDPFSYYWCVPNVLGGFHKYHIRCSTDELFVPLVGRCMLDAPLFGPYMPIDAIPSDRDVVKAEWKQLKKEMKAKAKELKIRHKMLAKAKAHAEKLAAKKQKKHDNDDDDDDDEDDD